MAHRDPALSRRTPVDSNYATCERTTVSLCVCLDSRPSSWVTTVLGVPPTSATDAGHEVPGSKRVARITGWFLESEDYVDSRDVREHLDWLALRLRGREQQMLELQREEGVSVTVSCVWWSKFGEGGPTIWPEQMGFLSRMGLELGFQLSFYGDED